MAELVGSRFMISNLYIRRRRELVSTASLDSQFIGASYSSRRRAMGNTIAIFYYILMFGHWTFLLIPGWIVDAISISFRFMTQSLYPGFDK